MSLFFRKYRALKITGIIVLLVAGTIAGVSAYLSRHYKNLLQARLPEIAAKATDSLYRITAGDIRVNVLTQSVSVFNLHLRPDSSVVARRRAAKMLPPMLLDISIREVELSGLKPGALKKSNELICRNADIYHPKINIAITDTADRKRAPAPEKPPALQRIFVKALNIHDPQVMIAGGEEKNALTVKLKGGEIALREWNYEPGKTPDASRFFSAKNASVQLCNIECRQPGGLYMFGMDTLQFKSIAHSAMLRGLYIKPAVSRQDFYKEVKVQKEIYEGSFPVVQISGLQWEALLQKRGFYAARIDMSTPALDVYLSRSYPVSTESKVGNYPHQLLRKIGFPVHIPVITLFRGGFHYTELNEKTKLPGNLDFSSISGVITGISNRVGELEKGAHCMIKLTGKFMRKSNLGVVFDFPLNAQEGQFSVTGQLQEMSGSQVNETAKAVALAEIKSLQIHKIDFAITGTDYTSSGKITILYNDLKVKIKRVDTATLRLRNRGFVSFIANELVLYNDNPMAGEPVRRAVTHIARDPTKSFFNLIWRNIFEAGVQTAVRQEGITDLVKKRQANKGKAKLHFFRKLFPKRKKK